MGASYFLGNLKENTSSYSKDSSQRKADYIRFDNKRKYDSGKVNERLIKRPYWFMRTVIKCSENINLVQHRLGKPPIVDRIGLFVINLALSSISPSILRAERAAGTLSFNIIP